MKKLNAVEVERAKKAHIVLDNKVGIDWRKLPHVFELKAHGNVTIDMQATFSNIAASYKESKGRHIPVEIFRINNTTGRKTKEYINPLFGE